MKLSKNIAFFILLTVLATLLAHPARSNAASLNQRQYNQLQIGDILFGKSESSKLKLFGSPINFDGKVFKSRLLKDDEIVVYRIVITCCIADGAPLGIVVKAPAGFVKMLRNGDWVNVQGMLKLLPFNPKFKNIDPVTNMELPTKMIPYFIATKAVKKAAPRDEYLYP
jgi:uncharacterized membrane protein YcgQ (UPF0703/DUF1980 family)